MPDPPAADFVGYADRASRPSGWRRADRLGVGPDGIEVEVVGWVEDTYFLHQGGLWVNPTTWREVLGSSRPDAVLPDGTFQAPGGRHRARGRPGGGGRGHRRGHRRSTETVTREEAVLALPGVKEQNTTLSAIIYITFFVVGIVVALFFALVTLERSALYAVLKAIGASSRQLLRPGWSCRPSSWPASALALGGAARCTC